MKSICFYRLAVNHNRKTGSISLLRNLPLISTRRPAMSFATCASQTRLNSNIFLKRAIYV
ncbi:MAG: hypothetical protein WCL07_02210 [bacterium]